MGSGIVSKWRNPTALAETTAFTLVEVMVALVILAIGVLGVAGLLVTTVQSNRGATNRSRADELIYEKVEEFQSTSYAAITSGSDEVTIDGVVFAREWTVTPNDPTSGVLTIDVTAQWSERGQTFEVESSTMRSAN
jgi:type IV pilus modification protein PilV